MATKCKHCGAIIYRTEGGVYLSRTNHGDACTRPKPGTNGRGWANREPMGTSHEPGPQGARV